jgi:hypothetical protein
MTVRENNRKELRQCSDDDDDESYKARARRKERKMGLGRWMDTEIPQFIIHYVRRKQA